MSTTDERIEKAKTKAQKRKADQAEVVRLTDKGMSKLAISQKLGISVSTIRNLLKP